MTQVLQPLGVEQHEHDSGRLALTIQTPATPGGEPQPTWAATVAGVRPSAGNAASPDLATVNLQLPSSAVVKLSGGMPVKLLVNFDAEGEHEMYAEPQQADRSLQTAKLDRIRHEGYAPRPGARRGRWQAKRFAPFDLTSPGSRH